jgi:peptide chain release factor 1
MKDFNFQLDAILKKYKEIEKQLSSQAVLERNKLIELNKEYSELTSIVEVINRFNGHKQDLLNLNELLKDDDSSIREMAEAEIKVKNYQLKLIEDELLKSLIPKDVNDEKNSILEIRAGTGGVEASLFAADLFTMYQKYSELNSWKFDILSISETGLKGIKEAICNISGRNVFSKMKFESGVHRVQRVPTTESSGRVHTSAANKDASTPPVPALISNIEFFSSLTSFGIKDLSNSSSINFS